MARIYYASSWRNPHQPAEVQLLREYGHEVYDFRNPDHGLGGFHWSELDEDWQNWTPEAYRRQLLKHPIAAQGFTSDFRAMRWADTCIMRLPCGNSAHTELGWATGAGKRTIIILDAERFQPDLMYLLADSICLDINEAIDVLNRG